MVSGPGGVLAGTPTRTSRDTLWESGMQVGCEEHTPGPFSGQAADTVHVRDAGLPGAPLQPHWLVQQPSPGQHPGNAHPGLPTKSPHLHKVSSRFTAPSSLTWGPGLYSVVPGESST